MLEELFDIQNRLAKAINLKFKRYLYNEINWDSRLIIIAGARGTGKTTLVLQHFIERYGDIKKCLYFSADNPIVLKNGLFNIANEYFKFYGDVIIIDEIHKYKNWSMEVKSIYDSFPNKKIIILGSSTLNILYEKGDLSRRAVIYKMRLLSFREYLSIKRNITFPKYEFTDIIKNHIDISTELTNKTDKILKDFLNYLKLGTYPFFLEFSEDEYLGILSNVLDKVIYEDISTIKSLKTFSSINLKKLIAFLGLSKIPVFNIEALSNELGVTRVTIYEYFNLLERADILNIVRTKSTKLRAFKNSKILFSSPNIYYSISQDFWGRSADKGNLRESFFASQLKDIYILFTSLKSDFIVETNDEAYEIEVGGRNKKDKKIYEDKNYFIFKDGIEIGNYKSIPLYLAGFLY